MIEKRKRVVLEGAFKNLQRNELKTNSGRKKTNADESDDDAYFLISFERGGASLHVTFVLKFCDQKIEAPPSLHQNKKQSWF